MAEWFLVPDLKSGDSKSKFYSNLHRPEPASVPPVSSDSSSFAFI